MKNNVAQMLDAAVALASRGLRVMPIHVPEFGTDGIVRCSCREPECWIRADGSGGGEKYKNVGKHPRIMQWGTKATTDNGRIHEWWGQQFRGSNIGVVCGTLPDATEGLVVLDVDLRNNGDDTIKDLERELGALPPTIQALSGSGGPHYYFRTTTALGSSKLPPGVDVQAGQRGVYNQVVAPPSLHWSGRRYTWEVSSDPGDGIAIEQLPDAWLQRILRGNPKAGPLVVLDASSPILDGQGGTQGEGRKAVLISRGRSMWAKGFARDEIDAALAVMNKRCVPPLNDHDLTRVVDHICKVAPGLSPAYEAVATAAPKKKAAKPAPPSDEPEDFEETEALDALAALEALSPAAKPEQRKPLARNAESFSQVLISEQFVADHVSDLRFVHESGWICWTGTRWERDDLRPHHLAKAAVKKAAERARIVYEQAIATKVVGALLKASTVGAVVQLAKSDPRFTIHQDELDADPWILNCANGVLDLRTGELRAARREDLCTKSSPVAFDAAAQAPVWLAFLERVLPDPELRSFVQRLAGYALTGVIREHVLPIFWGKGRNGKSTFIEAISFICGDYAHPVPAALLRVQQGEGHPTMQAQLFGVRFAPAQETERKFVLAEALVKQLTGGDPVTARYMREDFFTFKPTHKMALATNNKPRITGTDEGIWSRVLLVPWTVFIPEAERDTELRSKLEREAPGILAWAAQGCLEWQKRGLSPPESVRIATQGFRAESDAVGRFLEDRCVRLEGTKTQATALYQAFEQWCKAEGERAESQKAFGQALNERDVVRKTINGRQWYAGLGLRALDPPRGAADDEQVEDVDRVDRSAVPPLHVRDVCIRTEESSTPSTSSTRSKEEEDAVDYPIRRFLRERCEKTGTETLLLLFEHWEAFVENQGLAPGSESSFAEALRGLGFTTSGVLAVGISLRPEASQEAPGETGGPA